MNDKITLPFVESRRTAIHFAAGGRNRISGITYYLTIRDLLGETYNERLFFEVKDRTCLYCGEITDNLEEGIKVILSECDITFPIEDVPREARIAHARCALKQENIDAEPVPFGGKRGNVSILDGLGMEEE